MVAADVREAPESDSGTKNIASGVDREIYAGNQRIFEGRGHYVVAALCVAYTAFHIGVMNLYPLETWVYRLAHVTGGLALGFTLFSARSFTDPQGRADTRSVIELALLGIAALLILTALGQIVLAVATGDLVATGRAAGQDGQHLRPCRSSPVRVWQSWRRGCSRPGTAANSRPVICFSPSRRLRWAFISLPTRISCAPAPRSFRIPNDMWASIAGILLILELTRRLAGLALVVIVAAFVAYAFVGPWLPGFLEHRGYAPQRFFAFLYTDNGILGPTNGWYRRPYIILFITFAAFCRRARWANIS